MKWNRVLYRFFAVMGVVLTAVACIGGVFLLLTMSRGLSARDNPSWPEAALARVVRDASIPDTAVQLKNPVKPTPDVMEEARMHWADHCAICHANDGSGEVTIGRNLFPKAPDMRKSQTQGLTDGELYYIIQNGIRLTGMPAWGAPVDDDSQTWSLVAFIRHLPRMTLEEANDMKKLNPKSVHELQEQEEEDAFLNQTE